MTLNSIMLEAAANGGMGQSGMMNILMIVALIAIFYFFMIRPQSKKQKEIRKFRDGLSVGDKVITAGGIHGKIKDVKDNVIILEIADNVRIKIDKGSVYPSAADAAADQNNTNDSSK